ncbi:hypothetical protein [Rhizosphaericola mali]|uniref:Uncharacterized protein n=1 Tax=Rhizosphaericola mali TaxID=2545455 RepID=A0A5P2FYH6_9BACT|nr:hypothetical protein [Rhizosphaericola mali]QES88556.1 hypothetical protein E0W69_007730 [Rhizosphaericola mali]
MSNLSNKTDYKALSIMGTIVKIFERLHYLDKTKEDDMDATPAKNLLQGIIESNNYRVNYDRNNKKPIIKIKEL